MELEAKLDQDYLFYCGFTSTFFSRIKDEEVKIRCQQWLRKLLGEKCVGIDSKRCRNIYLTQLLVCMQNNVLEGPFKMAPGEIDISDAFDVFEPISESCKEPDWLMEKDDIPQSDGRNQKEGRTYIATRVLPGGVGAFAYVAISMGDEEPKWIGGGEGLLERKLSEKFREYVPPVYEMEKILARRKDPKEREKVLTFYDVLMQNIADELDGVIEEQQNDTVNGLLEQLVEDLKNKEQYQEFEDMNEKQRRKTLLSMLHNNVQTRRFKISKREEILDEIEQKLMPESFFDDSALPEDKYELPAVMWEQAINKYPSKANIAKLKAHYPMFLVEKFVELLAKLKEEIAMQMHRRHENMLTQMKKELRMEGERGQKKMASARKSSDIAWNILIAVREAYQKKADVDKKNLEAKSMKLSEHSKLYDRMREVVLEKQKEVEEEAAHGQELAAEINAVANQTDLYMHINDETIRKTEETNIAIMKNLKRLRAAVQQYENRIATLKNMGKTSIQTASQSASFVV
ncbi:uncharacterized protein LOC123682369 [Harmonia axyridis]|uniref:uncharacterized protein LOC123682369 n=1 Tax=Harmonia axyridis TaxID=115357 RepID=UPI001E276DCE|nr:uncharacterized protein LOC123682369 [Harmonia axyridis]